MRRLSIGTLAALLLMVGVTSDAAGDVRPQAAEAGVDVGALIDEASAYWGVNAAQMKRISFCESKWQPWRVNGSGHAGLFQFQTVAPRGQRESTWSYASRMAGYGGYSPLDPEANAFAAAWLLRAEGPRHWACR